MTETKAKQNQTQRNKSTNNELQHEKTKWTTFTYSRKETKLFKDTHQNNLQNTEHDTKPEKQHTQSEKYNSGIYQLKCLDCQLKYIGQTGRAFHTRCKEHILAIKNNDGNSGYSNHILNTGHKYGPITDTMDIV
jgi:hypothetical protein